MRGEEEPLYQTLDDVFNRLPHLNLGERVQSIPVFEVADVALADSISTHIVYYVLGQTEENNERYLVVESCAKEKAAGKLEGTYYPDCRSLSLLGEREISGYTALIPYFQVRREQKHL